MRRRMAISAFALLLALPLWAQHGGGHGGGRGGFSGGHVSGGIHPGASAGRGFSHAPSFSQGTFANRGFSNRGFSNRGVANRPFLHDGFRGSRFRDRRFRNNCFGYGCLGFGYPWAYGGYYDPYWWWDSGSSYDEDSERERAVANEMNRQNLEEQQMLHQEQADGDRDLYSGSTSDSRSMPDSRSTPAPRPGLNDPPQGTAIMPATVLVFRDQHTKEIQNYAIVGQTLWNFAPQHTEKIPLSELDLPATTQANDERGVTFKVPTSNEAQ
jgi:hypothetical protein